MQHSAKTPGRPYIPKGGNDLVETPPALARAIVDHFLPSGRLLDPCSGPQGPHGPFILAMDGLGSLNWCEIRLGRDFFQWQHPVDWIVTNPPWGQFRDFLQHAMTVADNVIFLISANHWFTRARQRDIAAAGFGLVELLNVPTPPEPWPQSGFTLAAAWLRRHWTGSTHFSYLATPPHPPRNRPAGHPRPTHPPPTLEKP